MTSAINKDTHEHKLELLGIGSMRDLALKANVEQAMEAIGVNWPIENVADIETLLKYGITGIPAMRFDGEIIFQKVVPDPEDIRIVLDLLLRSSNRSVRQIVVPTDFSATSANAFQYAVDMAEALGASIRLVHVHQSPVDMGNSLVSLDVQKALHQKQLQLESFAEGTGGVVTRLATVPIKMEVITGGVNEEIRKLSRLDETDLLVMGTQGTNNLIDKLLGRVSTDVARRADCPVLLIPPSARFRVPRSIVFANNYSYNSRRLLDNIFFFAEQFKSNIRFVNIREEQVETDMIEQIPVGSLEKKRGFQLQFTKVKSTSVLKGLQQYLEAIPADWIVMATHRRNFLEDLFHRSTTRQMILETHQPLLVLHQQDE